MIDINRTIKLVSGALFEREATWQSYLPEAGDWQKTALLLTGPLIIVSGTVAYVLSFLAADSSLFGLFRPTLLSTLVGFITSAIAVGGVAFIFSTLAGTFGGKNNFALGFAAVSLAFVPGYVGQALSGLPWIGGLLSLALGIFALVQLWKIIPLYLEVPAEKRATHYIVSLVATIIVMFIIGTVLTPLTRVGSDATVFTAPAGSNQANLPTGDGIIATAVRRGALMEEAMNDTYTPPANGQLTDAQVQSYVAVVKLVEERQQEAAERLQALADETEIADNDGDGAVATIRTLGAMMRGANELGKVATSEMETVKEIGGNWAEHQWVGRALMSASRQEGNNEAAAHNHALYQRYAAQLDGVIR